jgi:hypothetical protein
MVPLLGAAQAPPKAELLQCRMIWGRAQHNAYTDLVRYHDRWFCAFREGRNASSPDGALRVLTSIDGDKWESIAQVAWDGDLREPKLSTTADGHLLLSAIGAVAGPSGVQRRSLGWISDDGSTWGRANILAEPDWPLGRISWHLGRAYAMAFDASHPGPLRLYTSTDGSRFTLHSEKIPAEGRATEASLLFLNDGGAYALVRREGEPATALLGKSRSPYRGWTWSGLGKSIAGQALIQLPDGRLLAAGRLIDDTVRTSLCWIDPDQDVLTEFFALASSGDTGYPGVVYHDGVLWVSYYSSHEGKPMIYLAKVKLPPAIVKKTPRLTFGK